MQTTHTNETKFYATLWGSGCGASFTMPAWKLVELKASNKLTQRAGQVSMWFNGTPREFDLLTLEYGKENQ